jgi:hypothetical protein
MARPLIINDTLITRFCSVIRVSGSIQTAIMATGIGRDSYDRWAREVRERRASKAKVKFIRAAEQAEADIKTLREHQLSLHFDKNWKAVAWWLERKYPDEYGRRRRLPLPDMDGSAEQPQPSRVVWKEAAPVKPTEVEPVPTAA